MDAGDPVYVDVFGSGRRPATVVYERRGAVRVRYDDGDEQTVSPNKVHPKRGAPRANALARASTYVSELVCVEKPETDRAPWYLAWIRKQKCEWCSVTTGVQASHHPREGGGSTAMKCSDFRTLPLCFGCHHRFTVRQQIGSMTPEQTRQWAEEHLTDRLSAYIRESR